MPSCPTLSFITVHIWVKCFLKFLFPSIFGFFCLLALGCFLAALQCMCKFEVQISWYSFFKFDPPLRPQIPGGRTSMFLKEKHGTPSESKGPSRPTARTLLINSGASTLLLPYIFPVPLQNVKKPGKHGKVRRKN